jgi:hypothetical protein
VSGEPPSAPLRQHELEENLEGEQGFVPVLYDCSQPGMRRRGGGGGAGCREEAEEKKACSEVAAMNDESSQRDFRRI